MFRERTSDEFDESQSYTSRPSHLILPVRNASVRSRTPFLGPVKVAVCTKFSKASLRAGYRAALVAEARVSATAVLTHCRPTHKIIVCLSKAVVARPSAIAAQN